MPSINPTPIVSREEILPRDISTLYRCLWEVEVLYRELKTRYVLDEFDTTKKHVVEILVCAALLTLLVSRELLDLVSEHAADEAVFPSEHMVATFRLHAQLILHELSQHLGYTPPLLIDQIKNDLSSKRDSLPLHNGRWRIS